MPYLMIDCLKFHYKKIMYPENPEFDIYFKIYMTQEYMISIISRVVGLKALEKYCWVVKFVKSISVS